jgi:hypothetical protein
MATRTESGAAARRERFTWMQKLESDADVEAIPLSEPGTALADDGRYVDATSPKRGIVTSLEGERVPVGGVYIVMSETDPALWEKVRAAIR